MVATGNGTAQQCVHNLLSIIRGENPYERCKGIDSGLTDKPFTGSFGLLVEEANWVIKNYEPRATSEDATVMIEDVLQGRFRIAASVLSGG
ncbi:MAG: early E1A protein [Lachnospiraceae bacterium]|nr:early E1A protein [Lachnospiraceae bacterium]